MNLNLRATGPLRMLGVRLPEDEWLGELAPVQGNHAGHGWQLEWLRPNCATSTIRLHRRLQACQLCCL